ncbi:hypothetical protein M409DRAFT_66994 [Zasmidium cellare ATCC 36951]|uniref:Aquaporin n=1 Tax=Zasmidium cellare ATCC 36951 TaxID=1080233 RepID=A0A6A6CHZ3_ZASCE|nr:uncharacterized protein M409DRAFT_66994 [Zasmidium cellare ATCC 36951]KAF2165572.1 hypothetical protein M409DRAFT_66994 [Zasmidium cellare ATCC 36951]
MESATSGRLYKATTNRFVGRIGGNQEFVVDKDHEDCDGILSKAPDAAPGMLISQQLSLAGFAQLSLWKAALMEGVGSLLFIYITIWSNISPAVIPTAPTEQLGYFDNAAYLGPTTGALQNFILLTLFTFVFGVLTGAHLNPTITIGTFFARLTTLPRMVLYVSLQSFGVALAGYLVRAGYGTRDSKTGGCWLFTGGESQYALYPEGVGRAFSNEFMACLALLFLAFGVGLDPRQQKIIPPALSPFLVGLVLGVLSWAFGYSVYGYGGASMSPARCFGSFVGSHFPGWHWYHWVASISASIVHAVFYFMIPPGRSLVG